MEELNMLDTIERYIRGEMLPEERVYFENLRKTNPAVDQMVVEHTIFLNQMNQYGETAAFRANLEQIHNSLITKGDIEEETPAKVITLWKKYQRVIAVAASIAFVTAMGISGLVSYFSPKNNQLDLLNLRIDNTENRLNNVTHKINQATIPASAEDEAFKSGGTGFLIDTKGYIVTNAHVVKNATRVAVQNELGEFKVRIIHMDPNADLAFLKIEDSAFKFPNTVLPYGISKNGADLGEELFTLGYPRFDAIVYGKGYMSAKTGFEGDTMSYQIAVPANPGNSGTPVLNKDGDVVGIVRGSQHNAQAVAFAVRSKNIFSALDAIKSDSTVVKNDSAISKVKLQLGSTVKGLDRTQQIKKIQDAIFIVKAN